MNIRSLWCVRAAALVLMAITGPAMADDDGGRGNNGAPWALVGSWRATITPYNCTTGVEAPQFAFESLLQFGRGGTVVETTSNPNFAAGQRSTGLGNWERSGRNFYHMVVEALILFTLPEAPPPPRPYYQRGRQILTQGIEMQGADRWQSTGTVAFFDFSGTATTAAGCAKAVGQRIE